MAQTATDTAAAGRGDAWPYYVDSLQRSLLFLDVLRERGDNMLAHERAGQPPLLDFEHELVLDARTFDKPANYSLLRITRCGPTHASDFERQDLRPVLVIDPRAGHGPGIGGFKHDSELGVALHEGHPSYFAMFYWWSSYFFLSREEILATVENLFIGNRLEQGQVQLDPCEMENPCVVDLKRIRNPMVIFASSGDNITPPHQALAWLPAIYPDTAAFKTAGQRIVYLLNPHVGHLGIFVSATVAQHEHRAILENIEAFKNLKPGLYEMKIGEPLESPPLRGAGKPAGGDTPPARHKVWFEERRVEDLQFNYPRKAFEKVAAVSQWNERAYRTWVRPWIKWSANPVSAFMEKWGHPMRLQRYLFSPQITPAMAWVAFAAAWVRETRQAAAEDNPWRRREEAVGKSIAGSLEQWRVQRDAAQEHLFTLLYGRS